jgi:hypothetical protein
MNTQFKIYSLDTKAFYNESEEKLNKRIMWIDTKLNIVKEYTLYTYLKARGEDMKYDFKSLMDYYRQQKRSRVQIVDGKFVSLTKDNSKWIRKYINKLMKDNKKILKDKKFKDILALNKIVIKYTEHDAEEVAANLKIRESNRKISKENKTNKIKTKKLLTIKEKIIEELNKQLKDNITVRTLNPKKMSKYNLIALTDSDLSRTMSIDASSISTDLLIVRVYHYTVLDQLIKDGYIFNGEKYISLTASAGMIREKRVLFIKEAIWKLIEGNVMCGLTLESINKQGGMNINKFLSYLALCMTQSQEIEGFDIRKCIVIPDFETVLPQRQVDYIDNVTFKVEENVKKDITITHSDGCGWCLNGSKSFQIRLPWFKGLITPVNYIAWNRQYNNGNYKTTDIYEKEHDLLAEGIEYVFTESQFKMHKYYKDWEDYQKKFEDNLCKASYCNMEDDYKDFKDGNMNYQFWQTLTDISDEEIEIFTNPIDKYVTKAYTDTSTMLNILGADRERKYKSPLQKCLEVYPELIKDTYMKDMLSSAIGKVKNDAKYGKIKVKNTKNTFLIPDVFAWMQFVFLGAENVTGLLQDGECSCKLFKKEPRLAVNRSPHLYKEWCVRENTINEETNKWFTTNGIYTSCFDTISKVLKFDNDGDHSLVIGNHDLIKLAERNMEGVLPLEYEMGKAKAEIINPSNIYKGLTTGFKYSNIGEYSNKLTGIFNQDTITKKDENTAKVVCALNNYCIDSAKTLEMKELIKGSDIDIAYREANKLQLPYFFQFNKKKSEETLAPRNNSTVNRICKHIEDIKTKDYEFLETMTFRPSMMMHSKTKDIVIDDIVITEYKRLNKEMQKYFFKNTSMNKNEMAVAVYEIMSYEFESFCLVHEINYVDAVDMILKYIYKSDRDCKKALLFNVFGDTIFDNLVGNITKPLGDKFLMCTCCGKRVKRNSNSQKMCSECATTK